VVHYVTGAGPQFGAILAGADVRTAELGPDELLSTFALVLPLGLALALLMGSWISRRALAAVDQIITEVREITDGRSLHRRLAEPLVEGRARSPRRNAEPDDDPTRAQLRPALRRFTADASHELKTPLTVVRAGVERAITTPNLAAGHAGHSGGDASGDQADDGAGGRAAHAGEGPTKASRRLHREPVDLREIVEEVRETGELLAEESGVRVEGGHRRPSRWSSPSMRRGSAS